MTFKPTPLPNNYAFLAKEKGPNVLIEALKLHGLLEDKAAGKSNALIVAWAKEVGEQIANVYKSDDIPWCGLFMGVVCKRAKYEPPVNMLWALSWSGFGRPVDVPMLGDVMVFTRNGGGHVGLYVGEDDWAYHILGGNQKDSVCITRIDKARFYCARRCIWRYGQPDNVRVIKLTAGGTLSKNEA